MKRVKALGGDRRPLNSEAVAGNPHALHVSVFDDMGVPERAGR